MDVVRQSDVSSLKKRFGRNVAALRTNGDAQPDALDTEICNVLRRGASSI
jgi:hypothetical protein